MACGKIYGYVICRFTVVTHKPVTAKLTLPMSIYEMWFPYHGDSNFGVRERGMNDAVVRSRTRLSMCTTALGYQSCTGPAIRYIRDITEI
ncbi:hypothetical protein SERLA73DRAFT_74308 [Serpula lacrymans var. lacrymans S7.3]|uniref:Uncharacterized protein n=2 Tax=Serpula lacrymans var. lacrymans TaxID=341189 RepID=F8Q176_SERL3|nr:uncharacterized protein SERLADRAFT_438953 [Serpula lacrymans var. lacrymans S7.9]EGN98054.1 hypothetical protein SERLA73DRAFT_74308 [Serpula lacrymans var. lacrymans S7.3]EGO23644.1 hypothetical protein SERLADRAFT_438953 [Serpula lacrymans var. lacrymans S7.9]